MNTSIPVFKIHKIQHFDTIYETSLFEIANFHEQNHFITKAYDWRNNAEMSILPVWQWSLWVKMLKLTPPLNADSS